MEIRPDQLGGFRAAIADPVAYPLSQYLRPGQMGSGAGPMYAGAHQSPRLLACLRRQRQHGIGEGLPNDCGVSRNLTKNRRIARPSVAVTRGVLLECGKRW